MQISSITDLEYICIVGNFNNADSKDEEQALRDRGYSEERIRYLLKDQKGSSFKSLDVVFHAKNNLKYPYFTYTYTAFLNYQRGVLPYPGSLSEQPGKIMDIFNVFQALKYEADDKMRKKVEKESKKRGKS